MDLKNHRFFYADNSARFMAFRLSAYDHYALGLLTENYYFCTYVSMYSMY